MTPPAVMRPDEFLAAAARVGLAKPDALAPYWGAANSGTSPHDLAGQLVRAGVLTPYQAERLLAGQTRGFFLGKYKLQAVLGQGGMGKVYLAEHATMGHRVAIKVLPAESRADSTLLARFQREARAIARIDHPNVVRAYDLDESGDDVFLVLEYVPGLTLDAVVARYGPLDAARAADYVRQAALGLHEVSAARLTHRDIKPANLIVSASGQVKILDLGLASFHDDPTGGLTCHGPGYGILGTADYLAPEQAVAASSVDIRADLYALGASLFYLLAGRPPFDGQTLTQKILAHQLTPPPDLRVERPDVPATLVAVMEKLLAKNPAERYQTPGELADALGALVGSPPAPLAVEPGRAQRETERMPHATRPGHGNRGGQGPDPAETPAPARTPPPAARRPGPTAGSAVVPLSAVVVPPAPASGQHSGRLRVRSQEVLAEAVAQARAGNRDLARQLLNEVTAAEPEHEAAWLWLAAVSDAPRTAVACLERVLSINPGHARAKAGLRQARLNLARGYADAGQTSEAIDALKTLLAESPDCDEARALLAQLRAPAPRSSGLIALPPADPNAKPVLVVDDSAPVRRLLKLTLSKAGYPVIEAESGEQALELLRTAPEIGLAVIDIQLSGMDGFQLCKLLRQRPATATVPVVVLTGRDGFLDKMRGRSAGVSHYVTKPFNPAEFVKLVGASMKG